MPGGFTPGKGRGEDAGEHEKVLGALEAGLHPVAHGTTPCTHRPGAEADEPDPIACAPDRYNSSKRY